MCRFMGFGSTEMGSHKFGINLLCVVSNSVSSEFDKGLKKLICWVLGSQNLQWLGVTVLEFCWGDDYWSLWCEGFVI